MRAFGRLFWAAAFGSALLVLAVLSVGSEKVPYIADSDTLSHFLAYAATTTCAGLAFSVLRQRLLAAAATFLVSLVLELVQAFVPGRLPDMLDIAANGAGILLGLLMSHVILHMADGLSARKTKGLPGAGPASVSADRRSGPVRATDPVPATGSAPNLLANTALRP